MKRTIFTALMATALTLPVAAHAADGLISGTVNSGVSGTLATPASGNVGVTTSGNVGGATSGSLTGNAGGGANANIGGGANANIGGGANVDADTDFNTTVESDMDSTINDDDFDANSGVSTRATTNTRNNEYNPPVTNSTTQSRTTLDSTVNTTVDNMAGAAATLDTKNVTMVQQKLENRGYYDGNIDGIWGPQTARALTRFQQENNLRVTGNADAQTLQQLGLSASAAGSSRTSGSVR